MLQDLDFFTELNSQQTELASGGSITGYWNYETGEFVEVDYVGSLLDTYPSDPIGGGYRPLTPEEMDYLCYLGAIFGFSCTGSFY
ncbi:MAG: hypothetical protein AB4372_31855 [Xenococcus sp. (in: cyanobacteria)]